MKKIFAIGLAALLAGCATVPPERAKDPNAFATYEAGMAHSKEQPLGSYWQQENKEAIAAATAPDVLKAFVKSPQAADALLAQVQPAYRTDPVVATQIAAVSQLVMCRKWDKAPAARVIWVAALERARASATDDYRKAFYRDQLAWCGFRK